MLGVETSPSLKPFLLNVQYKEDPTEVQDIDLSRFVPTEVDTSIGITVATMDRFTSRAKTKPMATKDGDSFNYPFVLVCFCNGVHAPGGTVAGSLPAKVKISTHTYLNTTG